MFAKLLYRSKSALSITSAKVGIFFASASIRHLLVRQNKKKMHFWCTLKFFCGILRKCQLRIAARNSARRAGFSSNTPL